MEEDTAQPANHVWSRITSFLQQLFSIKVIVTLVSLALFALFIRWLWTTVIPVATVEAKYQYRKTLENTFQVNSLKELILPDFSWFNLAERSSYRDYGIKIPALYLDEPVVFNVDPNNPDQYKQALKKGIAHASSTAFPDNSGVGYYFAHSSSADMRTQYNAVFYLLGKLEADDEIFIWHDGEKFEYQVYETTVTKAEDVSFLHDNYGQETIVLQTCWPPGTTDKRLLVFARRVIEE
jgi:LPXTG-site transpeptidase (sortase) family protein